MCWSFGIRHRRLIMATNLSPERKNYIFYLEDGGMFLKFCIVNYLWISGSYTKQHSVFFFIWLKSPQWARASSFLRFLHHTQRRTTVSRTPLDEWSARRRVLYLTTLNTHNRQTSMSPAGFEPTTPVSERLQTYALDRVATGTGSSVY